MKSHFSKQIFDDKNKWGLLSQGFFKLLLRRFRSAVAARSFWKILGICHWLKHLRILGTFSNECAIFLYFQINIFAFRPNFHAFYLLLPSNCLRWLPELLTGRIYHREWFSFLFCFDVPDKASAGFVASLVFFFTFVFVLYKFLLGIFASSCRSRLERSRSQDMRSKRILKLGNGWCSLFRIIAHVYSLELNENI